MGKEAAVATTTVKEKNLAVELTRKDKIWECPTCKKRTYEVPGQCSCGALARDFIEVEIIPEIIDREKYIALKNLIYDGKHISTGTVISLLRVDRVTKSMLKDKLIEKVAA